MNLELYQILLNIVLIISALYLICIVAFTFGLYNLREIFFYFNKKSDVKVSVLIAARNEGKNIKNLLQSLYNQSFSKNYFEVIIIDDHSDDDTISLIKNFAEEYKDFNLKFFKAEKEGKKAAISQALHLAENELILVTDADCVLPNTWIESIVDFYKKENCKMVLISNPCNPTGVMYDKKTIMSLVRSIDAIAVIDEAYMEFAPRSESVLDEIDNCDNLIVLKTVSKIGLAGLRCGFAVSNKELIAALKKTKSPYNLNSITQKSVAVALRNYRAIGENVEQIKLGTERLYDIVKRFDQRLGFEVRPSSANFVYLRFKQDGAARRIWAEMKKHSISLRISGNTLRITAGTSDEIDRFEEAFSQLDI